MVHIPCVLFATVAQSLSSALSVPVAREFNVLEARLEPDLPHPAAHHETYVSQQPSLPPPPPPLRLSRIGPPPRSTLHLDDSFYPLYWPASSSASPPASPPASSPPGSPPGSPSVLALALAPVNVRPAKRVVDNVPGERKTLPPTNRVHLPVNSDSHGYGTNSHHDGSPFPALLGLDLNEPSPSGLIKASPPLSQPLGVGLSSA